MGTGKTTVGRMLAGSLNSRFVDMDELIVEHENRPISEIFSQDGESVFRALETKTLNEIATQMPMVVSTGGGCIERAGNREILKQSGTTVFLDSPWDVIVERLSGQTGRPLADTASDMSELHGKFLKRLPFYRAADVTVKAGNRPPAVIVREITDIMNI